MKIGLDAKRAMQNFTGLGNYSRFVIHNLHRFYPQNTYELFAPRYNPNHKETQFHSDIKISVKEGFKPLWRTFWISKEVRKQGIDIYHGLSNELPVGIQHSGAKSIVTIHDLIFVRYPQLYPTIDRIIYDKKARYACKVADRIIAVSECTKRDLVYFYGVNPDKIDVVYQGCFDIFSEKVDTTKLEEIREAYDLPTKFILSVGSIEERKNLLLAVKALKDVPKDVHLIAIGKQTKYAEQVRKYAIENGLTDRVRMMSSIPLSDLPAILQLSSLFVYPSRFEGFGIPIIEALSSGVPVIAATGSCLEEAGGPNSLYVDPDDDKHLALEMNRVLNDKVLRSKMISEGLEYVKKFDKRVCSEELMKVYKKLKP